MTVEITQTELTPAQLRLAAGKTSDAPAARRMLAIALALEGVDRKTAADRCGMDRQTLRDWAHRRRFPEPGDRYRSLSGSHGANR